MHLSAVDKVVPSVDISPLPNAPEIVLGIISLRGRILPVLDIRKRFRLPEREIRLSDCLIIARTSKRTVALLADAALGLMVGGTQAVSAGEILPGLDYVEGVSRIDGDPILIHNLEGFLSLEEKSVLDKSLEGWGVATYLGLDLPEERSTELGRGIGLAAARFGFPDTDSFLSWLLSSPVTKEGVQGLASALTIGETYFFRDQPGFETLEEDALPALIRLCREHGKCLKFWSAGCSSGEEPYLLVILLRCLIPDCKEWDITILAADINTDFLAKAREGVYGRWPFRDTTQ